MSSAIRVLVVDDDIAVQSSLSGYLEDMGFVIRSASEAGKALAILATDPFDVAVMDVRLREMTGEELILRAHAIQPTTHFLIYTGSLGYQLPDSLVQIGVTPAEVLYKPVRALSMIANEIRRVSGRE